LANPLKKTEAVCSSRAGVRKKSPVTGRARTPVGVPIGAEATNAAAESGAITRDYFFGNVNYATRVIKDLKLLVKREAPFN
jgi:hypothetical protein